MPLEEVLAAVPELRDAQSVSELSGGLTNTNYKVDTERGSFVVRIAGRDTELLGIDRANEAHNTIAAAESGVGARVVASLPEHSALILEFIEGTRLNADDLPAGGGLPPFAGSACGCRTATSTSSRAFARWRRRCGSGRSSVSPATTTCSRRTSLTPAPSCASSTTRTRGTKSRPSTLA